LNETDFFSMFIPASWEVLKDSSDVVPAPTD
jgi:hypothetical protein